MEWEKALCMDNCCMLSKNGFNRTSKSGMVPKTAPKTNDFLPISLSLMTAKVIAPNTT